MADKGRNNRKKTAPISEIVEAGYVKDGELLRYKNKSKDLLMVGLARKAGIECLGKRGVSYTRFEQLAGSRLHRPSEHIMTVNGRTLQQIIGEIRDWQTTKDAGASSELCGSDSPVAKTRMDFPAPDGASPSSQRTVCCMCGMPDSNGKGHLISCSQCAASIHSGCAPAEMGAVASQWTCPGCRCSVCGSSKFSTQSQRRFQPCCVDSIPVGCPKNACAVELPTEGFVGLEWVNAVMDTRKLVEGIFLRDPEEEVVGQKDCDRDEMEVVSETVKSPNGWIQCCLDIAKDCGRWEEVAERLDAKFPRSSEADELCEPLKSVLSSLLPDREIKERKSALDFISKSILALAHKGVLPAADVGPSRSKRVSSIPPAWHGVPLKRRKLGHGGMHPHHNPQTGKADGVQLDSLNANMMNGYMGRRAPFGWPYTNVSQRFVPMQHYSSGATVERQSGMDHFTRQMFGSMARLGNFPGMPASGFPGMFGRKWQPRGWVPTVNGIRDPRWPIPEKPRQPLVNGNEKCWKPGGNDLYVTGTNGFIDNEAYQLKAKPIFEKAAAKLIDPGILAGLGINLNQHTSSEDTKTDPKDTDFPWFDLSTSKATFTSGSEQVPSSASEFSLDFASISDTIPTVECTSTRQGSEQHLQHPKERSVSENMDKEGSRMMDGAMSQRSVDQPSSRGGSPGVGDSGAGTSGLLVGAGYGSFKTSSKDFGIGTGVGDMGVHSKTQTLQKVVQVCELVDSELQEGGNLPEVEHRDPCGGVVNQENFKADHPMGSTSDGNGGVALAVDRPGPENSQGVSGVNMEVQEQVNPPNVAKGRSCSYDGVAVGDKQQAESTPNTPGCSDSATITDNGCETATQHNIMYEDGGWAQSMRSIDQQIEACCGQCNRRCHLGCLPKGQLQSASSWFCSQGCHDVSWGLADLNRKGLIQVDRLIDNTPVSWQLIRGGAVFGGKKCQGYVPRYNKSQKKQLRKVLQAVTDWLTPLHMVGNRPTAAFIQGESCNDSRRDLSNFHTAVLWVGATVVGFCLVRVFGVSVAEIPYVEIRQEYQGNKLARHLIGSLEQSLLRMGVETILMPLRNGKQDGGEKVDNWPLTLGYKEFHAVEPVDLSSFNLLHMPGVPFSVKKCVPETLVQFDMFCEKPPVPREVLVREMLQQQKSKHAHQKKTEQSHLEFGSKKKVRKQSKTPQIETPGSEMMEEQAKVCETRSHRVVRTSKRRLEGIQTILSSKRRSVQRSESEGEKGVMDCDEQPL